MSKKYTTEEFIEKAKEIHSDKYDYSKVDYKNNHTKVCIICHEKNKDGVEHGEFWQMPYSHLNGSGCSKCNGGVSMTTEEFIEKAKAVHSNKYDYSKVNYINAFTPVCIICPEHGEFWQKPNYHLNENGCAKCYGHIKYTTKEFIEKAKKVHEDKYDYFKVNYTNAYTKVCMICPIHGEFWQKPGSHLFGKGCPKCAKNNKLNTITFITKAKDVYDDKYDYSKVEYKGNKIKVCVICHEKDENGIEHGEFMIRPNDHLMNHGCPKCSIKNSSELRTKTTEEFIDEARKIHGDKYDYSKVNYVNGRNKVCIICHEKDKDGVEHGEFWQEAIGHLQRYGCPICGNKCNISEQLLLNKLKEHYTDIIYQYRNKQLLGRMSIDIFIPSLNVGIEYQGMQHFEPVKHFGGIEKFTQTVKRDKKKYQICKNNNIKLLYFTFNNNKPETYIDKIYSDVNELVETINNNKICI